MKPISEAICVAIESARREFATCAAHIVPGSSVAPAKALSVRLRGAPSCLWIPAGAATAWGTVACPLSSVVKLNGRRWTRARSARHVRTAVIFAAPVEQLSVEQQHGVDARSRGILAVAWIMVWQAAFALNLESHRVMKIADLIGLPRELNPIAHGGWPPRSRSLAPCASSNLVIAMEHADTECGDLIAALSKDVSHVMMLAIPVEIAGEASPDCRDVERRGIQCRGVQRPEVLARPALDRWLSIDDSELAALAWSVPRSRLAAAFGVTDAAIGARLRRAGLEQPPRGFWNRPRASCKTEAPAD